jgi:hypothetical protein
MSRALRSWPLRALGAVIELYCRGYISAGIVERVFALFSLRSL